LAEKFVKMGEKWGFLGLFEAGQIERKIGKIEMHMFLVDIPTCWC